MASPMNTRWAEEKARLKYKNERRSIRRALHHSSKKKKKPVMEPDLRDVERESTKTDLRVVDTLFTRKGRFPSA